MRFPLEENRLSLYLEIRTHSDADHDFDYVELGTIDKAHP